MLNNFKMATHEGLDYDSANGHYSDVVLTIRILMGKVKDVKRIFFIYTISYL